jgi:hypothetical protein
VDDRENEHEIVAYFVEHPIAMNEQLSDISHADLGHRSTSFRKSTE